MRVGVGFFVIVACGLGIQAASAGCNTGAYEEDIKWSIDMNCGTGTARCTARDTMREGLRTNNKDLVWVGFSNAQFNHNPEAVNNGEECNKGFPDFLVENAKKYCSGPPCKFW